MPAPKVQQSNQLKGIKLQDTTYHQYEYQTVPSSEGRFEYDGTLPRINSKYKKLSVDIKLGKFSKRNLSYLHVPLSDLVYEVTSPVMPKTALFKHQSFSEVKHVQLKDERAELAKMTQGLVSKAVPLKLLEGAAALLSQR